MGSVRQRWMTVAFFVSAVILGACGTEQASESTSTTNAIVTTTGASSTQPSAAIDATQTPPVVSTTTSSTIDVLPSTSTTTTPTATTSDASPPPTSTESPAAPTLVSPEDGQLVQVENLTWKYPAVFEVPSGAEGARFEYRRCGTTCEPWYTVVGPPEVGWWAGFALVLDVVFEWRVTALYDGDEATSELWTFTAEVLVPTTTTTPSSTTTSTNTPDTTTSSTQP